MASTSPRPGPAILYAPPPRAPQLENAPGSPWHAPPILVSGTSAYRLGEFLYQDYLFDDRGAGSTYTYPSDPRYAGDAADLVEFRLKPLGSGLLIRLTYNAMIDPSLVASTIALGNSAVAYPLPWGAGAKEPAQYFVTVHGTSVAVTDAATGQPVNASGTTARVDLNRRQVQVFVPGSVVNATTTTTLRVASASGLWDTTRNQYLQPVSGAATTTQPGANGTTGSALFNVAFRFGESGAWRDTNQATALKTRDLSQFYANVDFAKLRAGVTDNMYDQNVGVPTHGYENRIYASHFEDAQGRGPQPGTQYCREPCPRVPDYASQLQPYALYVPDKPAPRRGYGMTLNLHYCGGNYNQGPPDDQALADRATGSVVLTPEGRIPCGWYWSEGGADVFEAWADVGRHFKLDPAYNAISGWSMGGYGTYKLLAQYPDLFARALPDIGCVSAETGWPGEPFPSISGPDAEIINLVPSFRNVPILSANANADTLCVTSSQLEVFARLYSLRYRYDWREYTGGHGPYYPTSEESAAFLGGAKVNPNPPRVTWVLDEAMNEPRWGLTSHHVYWLSGVRLRDATGPQGPQLGTVDAFSHGFGLANPRANPPQTTKGTSGSYVYTGQLRTWQTPTRVAATDELDISLTNLGRVTVDVRRAHLNCRVRIHVRSDGPAVVRLAGCARTISVG
ncbi:MAG: prolyl oligopeptidase family serine peptidase [Solirubrobacterales bacterium]|nr:prolyl oligopeptidase family serine peptidase [Solirubrobacterales bacterium]